MTRQLLIKILALFSSITLAGLLIWKMTQAMSSPAPSPRPIATAVSADPGADTPEGSADATPDDPFLMLPSSKSGPIQLEPTPEQILMLPSSKDMILPTRAMPILKRHPDLESKDPDMVPMLRSSKTLIIDHQSLFASPTPTPEKATP